MLIRFSSTIIKPIEDDLCRYAIVKSKRMRSAAAKAFIAFAKSHCGWGFLLNLLILETHKTWKSNSSSPFSYFLVLELIKFCFYNKVNLSASFFFSRPSTLSYPPLSSHLPSNAFNFFLLTFFDIQPKNFPSIREKSHKSKKERFMPLHIFPRLVTDRKAFERKVFSPLPWFSHAGLSVA
jgi:hypothetical protein